MNMHSYVRSLWLKSLVVLVRPCSLIAMVVYFGEGSTFLLSCVVDIRRRFGIVDLTVEVRDS